MKKVIFILFVSVLLPTFCIHGQSALSYLERSMFSTTDSTLRNSYLIPGTDGTIDFKEYHVGPGDVFTVSVNGIDEITALLKVDLEGAIYIPKAGGVNLRGKTLEEAKQVIREFILKKFKNVEVFISLNSSRLIKMGLYGDVRKPQSYILNATSRLNDLLSISAGISSTSDLRNIHIIAKSGASRQYDLLKFYRNGDKSSNPILSEGDNVFVNKSDKSISITGSVKYPGTYEFIENETVASILEICGGLLLSAKKDSIEIISFENDQIKQTSAFYSYSALTAQKILLKNHDRVIVRVIPEIFTDNIIYIEGFVQYPGPYRIVEDKTTLTEVINLAGGFRKEASLIDASLKREIGVDKLDAEFERLKIIPRVDMTDDEYDYFKSKSRQKKGSVVVDFVKLFKDKSLKEDITLRRQDVINIPEKKDFIILLGQVVSPGNIPFKEGLTVNEYIELAGGYAWRAVKSEVRVIKANTGEWIDAEKITILKPGDTIWVPEDPPGPKFWTIFKDGLSILGQAAAVIAATIAVIVASR